MKKLTLIIAIALLMGCEKEKIQPTPAEPCCFRIIQPVYNEMACGIYPAFVFRDTCNNGTVFSECLTLTNKYNLPFAKDSIEVNPNYLVGTFWCEI